MHVFRLPQTLPLKHNSLFILAITQATVSIADNDRKWISLYTFCRPSLPRILVMGSDSFIQKLCSDFERSSVV